MTALGLYFGLQRGQPSAAPPVPLPPPTVPAAQVQNALRAAFEKERRERFIPLCWEPAFRAEPAPAISRYTIQFAFNADGVEIGRAISELKNQPSRVDVATCLRQQPIGLKLDLGGQKLSLPAQWTLPLSFP